MQKPTLMRSVKFFDERGSTIDISAALPSIKKDLDFVTDQTLITTSKHGVIRGLHYQRLHPQTKIVTVIEGEILDVLVPLRNTKDSLPKIYYFEMIHTDNSCLYVPPGFLHGYQVLSEQATLCYQIKGKYKPMEAVCVNPFDSFLNIQWRPLREQILSKKDMRGVAYKTLETNSFEL